MKKLEVDIYENVDYQTGEIIYELWFHDLGNLASQLLNTANNTVDLKQLKIYSEKINNLLNQGGY